MSYAVRSAYRLGSRLFIFIIFAACASTSEVAKTDTIEGDYERYVLVGPKKRIFIADFENKSTYGQYRLGAGIRDVLATELSKTGLFILLEREKLAAVLEEQSLAETGLISEPSAPRVGMLLGANAIIIGSIPQFGVRTEAYDIIITSGKKQVASCVVDVRIVDVNTGSIIWAGSGKGEAMRSYTNILGTGTAGGYDEALEGDAFRAAVVSLMEHLVPSLNNSPWSCTVAKTSGDKIYINAGQKSSLLIGTELAFYDLGEPIIDPTTGLELGREETLTGVGRVNSYLGDDAAVVYLTEGTLPSIGSIGRLK